MRKNLSKILCIGVILIMGLGILCACNDEDVVGEFYTLQQAYENGVLSEADLHSIAEYYNDSTKTYPESLVDTVSKNIKRAKTTLLRNDKSHPISYAKAEDFEILRYYGNYNGVYVIMLNSPYAESTLEIVDQWETIGGVDFHHQGHYKIEVVKI